MAALGLLMIPAIGSVYPVPPAPVNYFPYIFLGYLVIGLIRVIALRIQAPERLNAIREQVRTQHLPEMLAPEA